MAQEVRSRSNLADFKTFITAPSNDLRQSKTTTRSVGYHALPHDAVDITHALKTITIAMESDQSTITQMTQHNQHLANQLTVSLSGLDTATYNIFSLQSQLNALAYRGTGGGDNGAGTGNGGGKSGGGGGNSAGFPTLASSRHQFNFKVEPKRKVYDNNNYYLTHGHHIADNHTSATCKNK